MTTPRTNALMITSYGKPAFYIAPPFSLSSNSVIRVIDSSFPSSQHYSFALVHFTVWCRFFTFISSSSFAVMSFAIMDDIAIIPFSTACLDNE